MVQIIVESICRLLTRAVQCCCLLAVLSRGAEAARVTITVLATTDLHGNIYPIDYFTDRPAARGLGKLATLIRQVRAEQPNLILIDCGDTIQGTPLEYVYQTYVRTGHLPLHLSFSGPPLEQDPIMLAMNRAGYDAMVVGNHEFNFGLRNLEKARSEAKFPWLAANIAAPSGAKAFAPFLMKTVAGVKLAVIGITTPAVPMWEKPENYAGYQFLPGREAVEKTIAALRPEHPDLILVAAHAGLGRDGAESSRGENMVYEIATEVKGIDAIVFGHTHQQRAAFRLNDVLLIQPKNWGMSLARLDFVFDQRPPGGWTIVEKNGRLIPVTPATAPDQEILKLAQPYQEIAQRYLNTTVTEAPEALSAKLGRVQDDALIDAIHQVQLHYARAQVSFASVFNSRITVAKGPVTVRQIAALYVYENNLYAIEGDGRMVKDALENAARYFLSCQGQACATAPLINPRVIPFNYDTAEGVEYEIDLTQPEGRRIRSLRRNGRPLAPDQRLRIAINSYRAAGSAGYTMFQGAKVLWRSSEDIRQLMIDYFSERKNLPLRADGNWRIIPLEAQRNLQKQALAEATQANVY